MNIKIIVVYSIYFCVLHLSRQVSGTNNDLTDANLKPEDHLDSAEIISFILLVIKPYFDPQIFKLAFISFTVVTLYQIACYSHDWVELRPFFESEEEPSFIYQGLALVASSVILPFICLIFCLIYGFIKCYMGIFGQTILLTLLIMLIILKIIPKLLISCYIYICKCLSDFEDYLDNAI